MLIFVVLFCTLIPACTLPPSDNSPRFLDMQEFAQISNLTNAKAYLKAGQIGRAEPILRRMVRDNPDLVVTLNDLGYLLLLDGRYEEAEKVFNDALRIEPRLISIRINLARVYSLTEKYSEAIKQYEIAEDIIYNLSTRSYEEINKEPVVPGLIAKIKRNKASIYYLMGEYDEAICNSLIAQMENPVMQEVSIHSRLLMSLELLSAAHELLKSALIVHEDRLPASMMFDYGLVLVAMESFDTAILVFDRVLGISALGMEEKTASRFLRYAIEKNPSEALLIKESLLDDALSPCKRNKFDSAGYWPYHVNQLILDSYKEVCRSGTT
ncbi:MAG TPA: tetratricopeptide repeat protein [Oligoflexia bacterium]|nr:tetratricopeptide repeat protein [Oligoflexia bacterium]